MIISAATACVNSVDGDNVTCYPVDLMAS